MDKLMILDNKGLDFKASITESIVEFDFSEAKETIKKELKIYEVVEITDFKAGKKEIAKLRALHKGIEDYRKSLTKKYLENFKALETELKELSSLVVPSIENFDKQLKLEEVKEKDLKKLIINSFISKTLKNNCLEFEIEINPKWLNKTYKIEDIEKEVWEIIENFVTIKRVKRTIEFNSLTLEQANKMMEFLTVNKIDFKVL
ncbi:MAG: DUF1351 domain-containing protein [Fusobacteriaceae bacterium]